MENFVNMDSRQSNKTRIPHAGTLAEMNSSRTNARSGLVAPGFATNNTTLKPSGIAKPPKTPAATSQPVSSTTRAANGTTRSHARTGSFTSSVSSRTQPSRTASNSSFSQTVGPGSRPLPRPQTSMANRKPGLTSVPRPNTALDTHDEEEHTKSVLGKRKGTQISHNNSSHFTPGSYDKFMNYTTDWSPPATVSRLSDTSRMRSRDPSLSTMMDKLTLDDTQTHMEPPKTPGRTVKRKRAVPVSSSSRVPRPLHQSKSCSFISPSPSTRKPKSPQKHPPVIEHFLTKDSHTKAWDYDSKMQNLTDVAEMLCSRISQTGQDSAGLKEAVELYKSRVNELETARTELMETNFSLRIDLETTKNKVTSAEDALRNAERNHEIAMDDSERQLRIEAESVRQEGQKQVDAMASRHQDELQELRRRFETDLDHERALRQREINQVTSQTALDTQRVQMELSNKDREIEKLQRDFRAAQDDIELGKKKNRELRSNLETVSGNSVTLESSIRALKARIEFLESGSQEQSQAFESLQQQLEDALAQTNDAKEKLRKEETLRRKLHNQVQELKGNIRVFCRVRPPLQSEPAVDIAEINFPDESDDCKDISVMGPEEKSSLGVVSRKNNAFSFDRVFGPNTQNANVFDEISQLVQSALDGYNVCIFCYGQTGSGKTHTMSSDDGMIPRAVHQIYDTARCLEEKGWTYTMEGNFVEVYNENLNDLLGKVDDFDKKKHEIRHDMQKCKTTITDINTVTLDSPEMVESILRRAAANRSVAATKANERSSRSHSVFILKLLGENSITGEKSEGTLNLVDLAGSERLSHSGATGERLKETQNINRSLSCLGDVIGALGQGKEGGHIPYRNSKLTYLLQFSLGGNSKTLMFVMVSPLQAHLGETLTSLKFATKVHNTHIGTAKRVARIQN